MEAATVTFYTLCISLAYKLFQLALQVIPHITDAIQEWIERVAHVPVTCHWLSAVRSPAFLPCICAAAINFAKCCPAPATAQGAI